MKQIIVMILVLILTFGMSSCNSQPQEDSKREPPEKSKEEIVADLDHSAEFWFCVAPGQNSDIIAEYTVKNIDIQSREKNENYDTIIGDVTAESPYAVYTGTFLIKYLFQEGSGYSLYTVYQEIPGRYEVTAFPSKEYLENQYEPESLSDTFLDASVQAVEGTDTSCLVTYQHKYDENAYCTITETISCPCAFSDGGWHVDFYLGSISDSSRQYHSIPDITVAKIQEGIEAAVPSQIGTYDIESGIIEPDSKDVLITNITGCRILSSNSNIFNTSEFLVDLQMQFDPWLGCWLYLDSATSGGVYFVPAGIYDYLLNDRRISDGEPLQISVEIMKTITWNEGHEALYVNVVTTDNNPPMNLSGLTPGESILRTMTFGTLANGPDYFGRTYFLRDDEDEHYRCYIYFDENMKPLSFLYS